jgi:hypothetical protein
MLALFSSQRDVWRLLETRPLLTTTPAKEGVGQLEGLEAEFSSIVCFESEPPVPEETVVPGIDPDGVLDCPGRKRCHCSIGD